MVSRKYSRCYYNPSAKSLNYLRLQRIDTLRILRSNVMDVMNILNRSSKDSFLPHWIIRSMELVRFSVLDLHSRESLLHLTNRKRIWKVMKQNVHIVKKICCLTNSICPVPLNTKLEYSETANSDSLTVTLCGRLTRLGINMDEHKQSEWRRLQAMVVAASKLFSPALGVKF